MKKALLILALATLTSTVFAQSDKSKFHFGIKATPALAWLRIDADKGTNLTSDGAPFGFGYGLILDFGFAEHYAFSTGLEVAYRGGKTKESIDSTGGTNTKVIKADYSVQFIEVPLTLKLKTNEIGYMTYFFQVGFAPGFAIRTKQDLETHYANGTSNTDSKVDASDAISPFNLSLIIGAGAEYNLSGNTSLLFGLTFDNGFIDLLKGSDRKGISNYLGLTVGILF